MYAFVAALFLATAPAAVADRVALERDIVRWTNVERLARGLPPVTWSPTLGRAARAHSEEMARLGYFDHRSPVSENRTLRDRVQRAGLRADSFVLGENIAKSSPRHRMAWSIVQMWMHSEGHRQNILRRAFRYVGVGVARDGELTLAVQVFGSSP
jgi:uncharacterized protein YkwD